MYWRVPTYQNEIAKQQLLVCSELIHKIDVPQICLMARYTANDSHSIDIKSLLICGFEKKTIGFKALSVSSCNTAPTVSHDVSESI